MLNDVCSSTRRPACGVLTCRIVGFWLLTLLTAAGLGRAARAMDPDRHDTDGTPALAVLDLPRHGSLTGRWLDLPAEAAAGRTTLLWQSPAFVGPFEFALDSIVGIRFPQPAEGRELQTAGDWRIELVSGDQFVGEIESIDERQVVVTTGSLASPSRLVVRRDAVRGIFRGAPVAIAAGPGGSAGSSAGKLAGTRATLVAGESLFRDLKTGLRSRYDIALSWQERPTIRIAVGCDGADDATPGYRLELGRDGDGIVAVREEEGSDGGAGGRADLQPCGDLPENGLTLSVYVDQQAGRLAVMLPDANEPIADLTIPPTGGKAGGGIQIAVTAGRASLDSLRVTPWKGGSLSHAGTHEGEIYLRDGESLAAAVGKMEPGTGTIVVRAAGSEAATEPRRIALEQVDGILFPSEGLPATEQRTDDPEQAVGRSVVQATNLTGSRLTGRLLRVEQGTVWLEHPAVPEPVPLPMVTLAAITGPVSPAEPPTLSGRIGRLACGQESVWGCLVSGAGAGEANAGGDASPAAAIRWQPLGSLTASPLAAAGDGGQPQATITYADKGTSEASGAASDLQATNRQTTKRQATKLQATKQKATKLQTTKRFASLLILRTGETLPCRVEAIDEKGVRVQVSVGDLVTVAADLVQAVELVPAPGREMSAEKFRSLTTLPRSQRQQPPTHVLRSVEGDYLRGRLVAMDAQTIRIAVEASPRAAPLSIPRDQVARLIWLHPENLDAPWQPPQPPAGEGLLVESVSSDNDRLRMLAMRIEGNRLFGISPWLGPCDIDLEKTDRLLIGGARDDSPLPFPFTQWKLLAAPEPRNLPPRKP